MPGLFEALPHIMERLRLRPMRPDDLEAFHAYRRDPAVARYQGWEPMTVQAAADFLASQSGQTAHEPGTWRQLAIADRKTDTLLGDVGVWLSPDSVWSEFGLSLTPAAQGNGYGTECVRGLIGLVFATTPVTEIVASTDTRNAACLAVLSRAGMHRGEKRRAEYKGEPCTEYVFSIRRRDE